MPFLGYSPIHFGCVLSPKSIETERNSNRQIALTSRSASLASLSIDPKKLTDTEVRLAVVWIADLLNSLLF